MTEPPAPADRPTRRAPAPHLDGIVVIDKPRGPTSAQLVADVRHRLRLDRVGHTGTLDPMASGVLPMCLGEATKLVHWLIAEDKAYLGELELGVRTDTHDAEGQVVATDRAAAAAVTEAQVAAALAARVGPGMQVPPMFSAIKQGRRRLHELARAGQVVDREPRPIVIHRLTLLGFAEGRVRFELACSKGTYVRSLVEELGEALGCGAHLTALRRTLAGDFGLGGALRIEDVTPASVAAALRPLSTILPWPRVVVPRELTFAVTQARGGLLAPLAGPPVDGGRFQLVDPDGDLLALCSWRSDQLRFERVFCSPELLARRGA